jgi:hypothetical protein
MSGVMEPATLKIREVKKVDLTQPIERAFLVALQLKNEPKRPRNG